MCPRTSWPTSRTKSVDSRTWRICAYPKMTWKIFQRELVSLLITFIVSLGMHFLFSWCCFYIYHLTGDKNVGMKTLSFFNLIFSMKGNKMKSKLSPENGSNILLLNRNDFFWVFKWEWQMAVWLCRWQDFLFPNKKDIFKWKYIDKLLIIPP